MPWAPYVGHGLGWLSFSIGPSSADVVVLGNEGNSADGASVPGAVDATHVDDRLAVDALYVDNRLAVDALYVDDRQLGGGYANFCNRESLWDGADDMPCNPVSMVDEWTFRSLNGGGKIGADDDDSITEGRNGDYSYMGSVPVAPKSGWLGGIKAVGRGFQESGTNCAEDADRINGGSCFRGVRGGGNAGPRTTLASVTVQGSQPVVPDTQPLRNVRTIPTSAVAPAVISAQYASASIVVSGPKVPVGIPAYPVAPSTTSDAIVANNPPMSPRRLPADGQQILAPMTPKASALEVVMGAPGSRIARQDGAAGGVGQKDLSSQGRGPGHPAPKREPDGIVVPLDKASGKEKREARASDDIRTQLDGDSTWAETREKVPKGAWLEECPSWSLSSRARKLKRGLQRVSRKRRR
ncbi:hypothetical protein CBR_g3636 [Chara braunii]|uniref:Uncharacterized protein n=1 Tax=Chara braunii TaxID=69332 RepID=A0A388KG05_CHABU|nr:hypothetical protein CBR_g3636 [Chara braunii]|eukprot:GBG68937.1 hypothetical protein CBR_g3636 [Chara braunii]